MFTHHRPNTLPIELLHRIVTWVIADSVHAICVSPDSVVWEMHALPILCSVSYSFRAITIELAARAFKIGPSEDISCASLRITDQLERLRLFAMRLHLPTRPTSGSFQPLGDDSVLIHGYSLFLAAMDLRRNATGASVKTFENTHELILTVLATSLVMCGGVEPRGVADVLYGAMRYEMEIARSGLAIVKAAEVLKEHLKAWSALQESTEEDLDRMRVIKRMEIHEELEKIERADQHYTNAVGIHKTSTTANLPDVKPVIKRLHEISFGVDEYGIEARLETLVRRWAVACPFLAA